MENEAVSPEEMAELQAKAGENQGNDVTQLFQSVGQGLATLAQALNKAQGATPEDKQAMAEILQMYGDLVEKKMSAAPGENPEPEVPGPREMPMEGKGMPMGPQMRQ